MWVERVGATRNLRSRQVRRSGRNFLPHTHPPLLLPFLLLPLAVLALLMPLRSPGQPRACTYRTYSWNAAARRAEDVRELRKAYTDLAASERDASTGCTVCEEDQVEVRIPDVAPFRVCRIVAARVERALLAARASGFALRTVTAYRVGRTRGEVDATGRRTGFSNHSFGIAVDVNEATNGLYDRCARFGPGCRLIRGGPWRPGEPTAITRDGALVAAFAAEGFAWGGEIAGQQKDFMHFSPSGY